MMVMSSPATICGTRTSPDAPFFHPRGRSRAGRDVDDLDVLERAHFHGAHQHGIEFQRGGVFRAGHGRVMNEGPHEPPHQGISFRSMKMLSISLVLPMRSAPATSRSRRKSAGR